MTINDPEEESRIQEEEEDSEMLPFDLRCLEAMEAYTEEEEEEYTHPYVLIRSVFDQLVSEAMQAQEMPLRLREKTRFAPGRWVNLDASYLAAPGLIARLCLLQGSRWDHALLIGADFSRSDMTSAMMPWAILPGALFHGTSMQSVDLTGANMQGADFTWDATREEHQTNLQSASLVGADLQGANLQRVLLCYANLQGVNLRNANLRAADLRFVDMRHADLRGADLRRAMVQGANLEDVLWDGETLWPARSYRYGAKDFPGIQERIRRREEFLSREAEKKEE